MTFPAEEKIEEAKPLKTYTVYANKPFWCEVEAHDEEEAKRLAPDLGCWDECCADDEPLEEDIYRIEEVTPDELRLRAQVMARPGAPEEKTNA
jgi:hypothetical protein